MIRYENTCDFCGHKQDTSDGTELPVGWRLFMVYSHDCRAYHSNRKQPEAELELCANCYGKGMPKTAQEITVLRSWWHRKVFGHLKFWKGKDDASEVERKA